MEKQQIAIEWLVDMLDIDKNDSSTKDVIEQAKAMERMQREKDFVCGYKTRALGSNLIFDETSEMYAIKLFKETFKSE